MIMARINQVEPEVATGAAKELLTAVKSSLGIVPNLTKVMANAPGVLEVYLKGREGLSKGDLSPSEGERIALRVAELNQCNYCLSAHCAIGKNLGLDDDELRANRAGESEAPRIQALLDLTSAIVKERGKVSGEDLGNARNAGLSDGEIVEVVGHVAVNTLTNYINRLADTEIDFPEAEPLSTHEVACACSA
jgi:uncharacterized peroxidase-related enzyme